MALKGRVFALVGRWPPTFKNLLLLLAVYTLSLGVLVSYYERPAYFTAIDSKMAQGNVFVFRKGSGVFVSQRPHPQANRTSLVPSTAAMTTRSKNSIQQPPRQESVPFGRKNNRISTSTKTTRSTSTTSSTTTRKMIKTTTRKLTARTTRKMTTTKMTPIARLHRANVSMQSEGRGEQKATITKAPCAETATGKDFHPVQPDCQDFFVYSAHADLAFVNPTVTVVAIVNRTKYATGARLRCLYTSVTGQHCPATRGDHDVMGKLLVLPDHHNLGFAPALVHCPLLNPQKPQCPSKVSIRLDGNNSTASGQLDIQYPQPRRWKFLLCFSPLHGQFNDANLVVQNLELAQMLGAQHAVLYNTSIGANVNRVLNHYVRTGFLEVRGWRDPPEPVHYKAQMAAINDCLLYSRNSSDFAVFMDFDEMIVAKHHGSWMDLIEDVQRSYNAAPAAVLRKGTVAYMNDALVKALTTPRQANRTKTQSGSDPTRSMENHTAASDTVGAYAFVSSVFLWDNVSSLSTHDLSFANKLHLAFMLKQRRTTKLWPERSKNIVDPRAVRLMGIHRVHAFVKDETTLVVNATVALLQHYRWYSPSVPTVKDINVLRFAPGLVQRVKKVLDSLR